MGLFVGLIDSRIERGIVVLSGQVIRHVIAGYFRVNPALDPLAGDGALNRYTGACREQRP